MDAFFIGLKIQKALFYKRDIIAVASVTAAVANAITSFGILTEILISMNLQPPIGTELKTTSPFVELGKATVSHRSMISFRSQQKFILETSVWLVGLVVWLQR